MGGKISGILASWDKFDNKAVFFAIGAAACCRDLLFL
jgi:hypothetical protein